MKHYRFILVVIVLALLGGTITVEAKARKRRSTPRRERTKPKENTNNAQKCALDMVEYHYQAMRMEPVAEVRLERKGDKVVLVAKGTISEETEYVLEDGEELLKEALAIIEAENMLNYGVSYEPTIQPLDGYAWWFSARLADGRSVSSHGHNAQPEGEGLGKMHRLLFDRALKLMGIEY